MLEAYGDEYATAVCQCDWNRCRAILVEARAKGVRLSVSY